MSYVIEFTKNALNDIKLLKKSGNKKAISKLEFLFKELQEHPHRGTGQVEILKYFEIETFSRRINNEHRLVYQINEQKITVLVLTAFGHYK